MYRCQLVLICMIAQCNGALVFPPCLKNQSISPKKYLIYSDGSAHNVSIPSAGWASARIAGEISRIIVDEVMGYSTVLTDTGSDLSNQVVNWAVGCLNPDDPNCALNDVNNPRYHFTVESWEGAQERVAALPENLRPTAVRSLDFALDDQYYLNPDVLQAELNVAGCGLDWYRCYDARWHTPHKYFDTWQEMVRLLTVAGLQNCSTDSGFNPPSSNTYLEVTGDIDSMRRIPGTSDYVIECVDDVIWFSPACRHNTSLCVPLMVQYTRQQAMQLAVFHNVPLAIVQVQTDYLDAYYSAALSGRFLFGWYFPDDALINEQGDMPVMLNWPRYNALQYAEGIFSTGLDSAYPIQYCWPALPAAGNANDLMYFLRNYDLYDQVRPSRRKRAGGGGGGWG